MAETTASEVHRAGRFKDARGRRVTLLDPVTMRLLRWHGVIPAETVRELADEIGVGWSKRIRVLFSIALVLCQPSNDGYRPIGCHGQAKRRHAPPVSRDMPAPSAWATGERWAIRVHSLTSPNAAVGIEEVTDDTND